MMDDSKLQLLLSLEKLVSCLESLNGYDFSICEETDSAIEEAKALIAKFRNLKNHS